MTNKVKVKDTIKIREQLTNTSYFILPLFKVPLMKLDEYGFVNSFLYDKNKADNLPNGKTIYILFRPNEAQKVPLQKQIEDWETNGFFIEDYDYSDGYVVVILRFPDKYKDQYKLFLQGRYSEFSEDYKNEIPRKVSVILPSTGELYEDDSLQFLIINKRIRLKNYWKDQTDFDLGPEDEYWGKPVMEDYQFKDADDNIKTVKGETMDIDKIIEERKIKENDKPRNNK